MRPCFSVSALLLVTATLSPATATALSKNEATGEDIYPPLWDLAPDNLLDYLANNKIVINPWNYLERLGAYKILLSSSAKYFNASGYQQFDNILWGLPLQHGWQFRTGMRYILKLSFLYLFYIYQTPFGSSFPGFHKPGRASLGVSFDIP